MSDYRVDAVYDPSYHNLHMIHVCSRNRPHRFDFGQVTFEEKSFVLTLHPKGRSLHITKSSL